MTTISPLVTVEISRSLASFERGPELPLPTPMSEGAAGSDLRTDEAFTLAPLERRLIPTGICIAIPEGFEGQIRPRSGLAIRCGITLVNAPGTIDSDYRGEVKICLINLGRESFHAERGERIAQLVVAPVAKVQWQCVETLSETLRGDGGFGSTGHQ